MKNWFLTLAVFLGCAQLVAPLQAADALIEIEKIDQKKRVVHLKVEPLDGYEKGKRVCFFKENLAQDLLEKKSKKKKRKKKKKKRKKKKRRNKRIACGTVVRVLAKKNQVRVKVGRKKIKKIKKDMIVRLKGAGSDGKLAYDHGLKFYWLPHVIAPISYNRLSYSIPAVGETPKENLWEIQNSTSQGFLAGGFEYVLMSWGLGFGGRFRMDLPWVSETDYALIDKSEFVSHSQSGQAVGGWMVYYLLNGDFKLGLGVDYEASTATLKSVWSNDSGTVDTPIYEINSSLSVVSLRLPMQYDIYVDPIGLSFGIHGLVPLSASGGAAITVNDLNSNLSDIYSGSNVEADVIESLAHKQSSFGLDIVLGIFFGF